MSKHVVFQPEDLKDDDVLSDTVLWSAHFKLTKDFQDSLPSSLLAMVNAEKNPIAYPLKYWEKEFKNLGFEIHYDYPYAKEYDFSFLGETALTVTIKANDVNTNHTQLILPKNLAKKILKEMDLDLFGKIHPEKFYSKLTTYLDISADEISECEDSIFEALLELEYLCEECVRYESFILWRVC